MAIVEETAANVKSVYLAGKKQMILVLVIKVAGLTVGFGQLVQSLPKV